MAYRLLRCERHACFRAYSPEDSAEKLPEKSAENTAEKSPRKNRGYGGRYGAVQVQVPPSKFTTPSRFPFHGVFPVQETHSLARGRDVWCRVTNKSYIAYIESYRPTSTLGSRHLYHLGLLLLHHTLRVWNPHPVYTKGILLEAQSNVQLSFTTCTLIHDNTLDVAVRVFCYSGPSRNTSAPASISSIIT